VSTTDSARGALLGLACGDALGRPVEFMTAERIADVHGRVTTMLGHGTHGQPAGTITDDTEMALRLARSLVACGTFDGGDVAERFVAWEASDPFDVGLATRDAIRLLADGADWTEAGQQVWESRSEGQNAGNGSLMRCTPNALAFRGDPETLTRVSRRSSAITHADPRCTDACVAANHLVANLVAGVDDPLDATLAALDEADCEPTIREVVAGAPERDTADLENSGYVVDTLESAVHAGLTADDVETAIVETVNRGGDADTHGAVAGAVAGARFGASALPDRWLDPIEERDELVDLADRLDEAAPMPAP
jgi:ADP-ribosyl-[dinitrogen reductase] hydrolase